MEFHPGFRKNFSLGGQEFTVASLTPADRVHIREGLKYLSAESVRNRFLGQKRDFTDRELDYLTTLDGVNHYALGVEEATPPHRGVAVIRMVRSSEAQNEFEVAVTIIDEYQRMGLGSFLLDLLLLAGIERNVSTFFFYFLPQNEAIVKLVRKKGQAMTTKEDGLTKLSLPLHSLDPGQIRERVRSILPETGSGPKGT